MGTASTRIALMMVLLMALLNVLLFFVGNLIQRIKSAYRHYNTTNGRNPSGNESNRVASSIEATLLVLVQSRSSAEVCGCSTSVWDTMLCMMFSK